MDLGKLGGRCGVWLGLSVFEWHGDYPLILGTDVKLFFADEKRCRENSRSDHARESAGMKQRHARWCSHVDTIARNGERLYVGVGQSIAFGENLGGTAMKME